MLNVHETWKIFINLNEKRINAVSTKYKRTNDQLNGWTRYEWVEKHQSHWQTHSSHHRDLIFSTFKQETPKSQNTFLFLYEPPRITDFILRAAQHRPQPTWALHCCLSARIMEWEKWFTISIRILNEIPEKCEKQNVV